MQTVVLNNADDASPRREKHQRLQPISTDDLDDRRGSEQCDGGSSQGLSLSLEDRDLWTRFQCITNEMIVTKNGR